MPIVNVPSFGSIAPPVGVLPTNYIADVMADSPIGYWRLDDPRTGPSSTMADSSGNGYDGTVVEVGITPLYQQPGPFGIGDLCWSDEAVGSGFSYIRVITNAFDSVVGAASQPFTFEIWQRAPSSGSGTPNAVMDKTDIAGPANWNTMQVITNGNANAQLYDGSNNPSVNSNLTGSVEGASWFHLVMVREISPTPQILLYVNANLEGTAAVAAAVDTSNTINFSIGSREDNTDRHINHAVAHAAIYNTALSPARILSHYTIGTTTP